MGCCASKQKVRIRQRFVINEAMPGQGRDSLQDFRTVGLTDAEIDYLFNVFLLIDRDGSGEIDVGEFFSFFEIEHSPFGDKLFEYMDSNSNGDVDFHEFVMLVWYFGSLDTRALPEFAFTLYDTDNDGALSAVEVKNVIADVYGRLYGMNAHVRKMAAGIAASIKTEHVTMVAQGEMLFPMFRFQQLLRRKLFDEEFWMMQLKERMKRSANMAPSLAQTVALLAEYEKARVTGVSVAKRQNKVTGTRAGAIVAKPGKPGTAGSAS